MLLGFKFQLVPVLAHRARKFYKIEPSLAIDAEKCVGCHMCTNVCPHDVITGSEFAEISLMMAQFPMARPMFVVLMIAWNVVPAR